MKWTTLLWIFLLECSFAQHSVAFLKAPTQASTLPVYTPFEAITSTLYLHKGMPFVNARLDGKVARLLLDTGAPMLVLNGQVEAGEGTIPAASFATTFNLQGTQVQQFAWANIQRQNLDALILDMTHLEIATNQKLAGIIGYDILKDFELFIDYKNQQVLLLNPGNNKLHKAAKPLATLDFELQSHLPVIPVEVGGRVLYFGLDTGAGANLIDNDFQLTLSAALLTAMGEEEVRSIDQRSNRVESMLVEQVRIAELPFDNMKYLLTELTDLDKQSGIKIDGLLGFPFFEQVKCSIDYSNKKLHIWAVN